MPTVLAAVVALLGLVILIISVWGMITYKVWQYTGRGFGITNTHLAVAGLFWAIGAVSALLEAAAPVPADRGTALNIVLLLIGLGLFVVQLLLTSGLFGYLKQTLTGAAVTMQTFWAQARQWFWKLFGLWALIVLLVVVGIVVTLLALGWPLQQLTSGAWPAPQAVVILVGLVAATIIAVELYLMFLLSYAPFALVADGVGIRAAVGRSIQFMRRNLTRVLGLLILTFLVTLVPILVVSAITFALTLATVPQSVITGGMGIVWGAVSGYLTVFTTAAFLAFYLDRSKTAS